MVKALYQGKKRHLLRLQKININECYLAAHAALETGNGSPNGMGGGRAFNYKNQGEEKVYNMYGIGAVDNNSRLGGLGTAYYERWFTPELGIIGGAQFISEHFINSKKHKLQNTVYKMKWNPQSPTYHEYASSVNWADEISKNICKICGDDLSKIQSDIVFDIPKYKS